MRRRMLVLVPIAALLAGLAAGCGSSGPGAARSTVPSSSPSSASRGPGQAQVPAFAHIVVVMEENRAESQILGSAAAPYLNELAGSGVTLSSSYAIRHPSEPNYLALFSGSTQGLTDDSCPHTYAGDDLGAQLRMHGESFIGYADSLPAPGFSGCSSGAYARKHAPWTDFSNLPGTVSQPFTEFPTDFAQLPRVAFVIPNLDHDMHDGTIGQADTWLRSNLDGYVTWARSHNSLLIVTWDEDDDTARNQIPGVLAGAHLRSGPYAGRVDHYTMLRTIEAACGLPPLGAAAQRAPITGIWTG